MNLDVVVIDILLHDGTLHSYYIKPVNEKERVVIDRLADIFPEYFPEDSKDFAGIRIYNSSNCNISYFKSRIRSFRRDDKGRIKFCFEHKGIPVGPSKKGHGGIYNFILAPEWRLINLFVSDPYDSSTNDIEQKRQFRKNIYWDTDCKTQLVEMQLRSGRGTFSFTVSGTMTNHETHSSCSSCQCQEGEGYLSQTANSSLLKYLAGEDGTEKCFLDIIEKIAENNYVMLKPNIHGVGLDINAIIKEIIKNKRQKQHNT